MLFSSPNAVPVRHIDNTTNMRQFKKCFSTGVPQPGAPIERRIANDGEAYTYLQFTFHYGRNTDWQWGHAIVYAEIVHSLPRHSSAQNSISPPSKGFFRSNTE